MRTSRLVHATVFGGVVALGFPAMARAQAVPNGADVAEVRKQFVLDLDTLQSKFVALANAFPADKYSWRPAPGVRSVGEVFMHVASEFYVYTPMAWGATPSPAVAPDHAAMQKFEAMSTKADVLKHLADGFAYCQRVLGGTNPAALTGAQPLFGGHYTVIETSSDMAGDLHEHLGQLIAYARVNGIKPPWSK
jgi:DinB superfamily